MLLGRKVIRVATQIAGSIRTRPLVESKIKVTNLSIHHRQLKEWKDLNLHRFTATTGFLKQELNRSSFQTPFPVLLGLLYRFFSAMQELIYQMIKKIYIIVFLSSALAAL